MNINNLQPISGHHKEGGWKRNPRYGRGQPAKDHVLIPILYAVLLGGFGIISFLPQMTNADSRTFTVPFRGGELAFALFASLYSIRHRLVAVTPGLVVFLVFWSIYSVRIALDTYFRPVELGREREIYWLFGFGLSLIPAFALFATPRLKELQRAEWCLGGLLFITCLSSTFVGLKTLDSEGGRMMGNDVLNPITLGHLGASLALIGVHMLLSNSQMRLQLRLLLLIPIGIGLMVLALSASRGPLLALIVPLGLFMLSKINNLKVWALVVLVLLAGLYLGPRMLEMLSSIGGAMEDRVVRTSIKETMESDSRMALWSYGLDAFLNNPVFGMALDMPGIGYPHNSLIEAFMATGVVGGVMFIVLLMTGVVASLRIFRFRTADAWVGMLFLQHMISTMFSGTLYDNCDFWYSYAIVVTVGGTAFATKHSMTPISRG